MRANLDRETTIRQNLQSQKATQDALDQTNQSLELARTQSASDAADKLRARYSSAAEQIGSNNASLAAAGIISMASVADAWHKMGRLGDRDDCIRMLVAGLPGTDRLAAETDLIRSTCRAVLDQRMASVASKQTEWWGAGIDFTTTGAAFGPIHGWVFEGSRVKIRCNQLATKGVLSIVQDITIDRGLVEITMHHDEEFLQIHNAEIRAGGINIRFGGPTANGTTKVVFSSLQAYAGRIKFEEPNRPSLSRVLVFKHCNFDAPNIALSPYSDNYEIVFEHCHFSVKPFVHLNVNRGKPPVIRLEGDNTFSKEMAGFPVDTPQELLS